MAQTVILVEADLTPPGGGAGVTLRWADRAIRPMSPFDTLRPNKAWESRLIETPTLRRALVEDMTSLAAGWGVGTLLLANSDRALDAYRAHSWSEIRVYRWVEGRPFAEARQLFAGRAGYATNNRSAKRPNRISAAMYDPRVELDQPLQVNLYTGGGGMAGDSSIANRAKPLAYGDLSTSHVPAPKINPATGVYQLHDGAIQALTGVYDRGDNAGLVNDGDLANSAFDAATPAAAHYVTNKARGLVKINSNPVGLVTFGLQGEAGPYVSTAGPILARLLQRAGVPAGRIGASLTGLASAYPLAVFDQSGGPVRDLVEWVARSALAAVLPDRSGAWGATVIAPPKATPDFFIDQYDVVDLVEDDTAPLPAGVVRVGYDRVLSTFRSDDVAPAIRGSAAAIRLETEYRYAQLDNAAAKARGPGAWRTLTVDTALKQQVHAEALAADLMALFGLRPDGQPRTQWTVQIRLTDAAMDVPLGATVRLRYPPRGIDYRFLLIAEQPLKPRRDYTTWTLWG